MKMDKKKYDLILKSVGWILTFYLFVNLTLYVMGKLPHVVFWGSLIIIGILTVKAIPTARRRIDSME